MGNDHLKYLIQNQADETFVFNIFMTLNGLDINKSINDTDCYYNNYKRKIEIQQNYSTAHKKRFALLDGLL